MLYFLVDNRSGKSYIMAAIAQSGSKKGTVLILAHRNSLINQHKELFEKLDLENSNIRIESVFTEVNHLGEKRRCQFNNNRRRASIWGSKL